MIRGPIRTSPVLFCPYTPKNASRYHSRDFLNGFVSSPYTPTHIGSLNLYSSSKNLGICGFGHVILTFNIFVPKLAKLRYLSSKIRNMGSSWDGHIRNWKIDKQQVKTCKLTNKLKSLRERGKQVFQTPL